LTKELGPGVRRDDGVSAEAGKNIVVPAKAKKTPSFRREPKKIVIPAEAGIQKHISKEYSLQGFTFRR
jgi:hypothetical protein